MWGLGECHPDPPQWLANESVCKGIKLMPEIDHCNEEERRLSIEQSVLQELFSLEWLSIQTVLEEAEKPIDELLEDYSSEWGGVVSEEDDELLTAIEEMALVEEYHIGQADEEFSEDEGWLNDIENEIYKAGSNKFVLIFIVTSQDIP
ncbi:hypothetical protein EV401DRAFT_1892495 [Pisolithus croceorrhizus]|nr:hypothetical protein EV401DRAFT_1892495 [Pisolithus croceorrhizus]